MFYGIPTDKRELFLGALRSLVSIAPKKVHAQDMLITCGRSLSFQADRQFMASFARHAHTEQEKSLVWRLHVLTWAAANALHVEGDFVECGVLRGFCSAVLCQYLDFGKLDRRYYLYDTFSGLPEETSTEMERKLWNAGYEEESIDCDALYAQVCAVFSAYANVRVVRGVVPHSFEQAMPEKIAFLHVDMNSEKAEIAALDVLFDKVAAGGLIVLDDFGWLCNVNQNTAETAFFAERDHKVLELPTGQGLVLKHC
jgi:hypothetical protein